MEEEGMGSDEKVLVVLTNLPNQEAAEALAHALVTEKLAACVNILAPCRSVYTWEGTIVSEMEVPLLIKTRVACYPALEQAIIAMHPYSVPEILSFEALGGLPAYLAWVGHVVTPTA